MVQLSKEVLYVVVKGLNTVRYAQLAGGVFFAYDYFLTIGMEVELIWRSKWNFIKLLYLFQRYLTFYDTFYAAFLLQFGTDMSAGTCGTLFAQMGRVVAMASAVKNANYSDAPYPGFMGCFTLDAKAIHLEYVWASLLAYDAVSLIFVLIPGIQLFPLYQDRNGIMSHSRLSNVVFRDGVIYYITLFIFSLLNIIFTLTLDPATRSSLATMGRTLHSALASRVLLHMRETVHVDPDMITDRVQSHMHFTRNVHDIGSSSDI
ncbi:hypothetical protein CVT25_012975 [Psilocybe cyanescens]|uniref:DUF6533 domain-containing protein n=1 Tax=Psilocybe cyanescens TaxID=93625 RepID=A0A409VTW0_PSICY|nr:hypothetical protein CVT25_012975 [Psilocybe cyanescens]